MPIEQTTETDNTDNSGEVVDDNTTIKPRRKRSEKPWKPTLRQKRFIELVASDPKITPTQAVKAIYTPKNDNVARVRAHELMHNENVQLELAKYTGYMKNSLIKVVADAERRMPDASDKDVAPIMAVIERTANSVIDRVEGKAQSNINMTVKSVNLNIDLSS